VSRMRKPRTVAILALPGVQLLDVCGPLDVFAEANAQVQRWIVANPGLPYDIASPAGRLGLSTRHFTRLFTRQVGVTPAEYRKRYSSPDPGRPRSGASG
jgi:transcriptional regulator GlxA family with amidase domain